jgi:hypothetical protein
MLTHIRKHACMRTYTYLHAYMFNHTQVLDPKGQQASQRNIFNRTNSGMSVRSSVGNGNASAGRGLAAVRMDRERPQLTMDEVCWIWCCRSMCARNLLVHGIVYAWSSASRIVLASCTFVECAFYTSILLSYEVGLGLQVRELYPAEECLLDQMVQRLSLSDALWKKRRMILHTSMLLFIDVEEDMVVDSVPTCELQGATLKYEHDDLRNATV